MQASINRLVETVPLIGAPLALLVGAAAGRPDLGIITWNIPPEIIYIPNTPLDIVTSVHNPSGTNQEYAITGGTLELDLKTIIEEFAIHLGGKPTFTLTPNETTSFEFPGGFTYPRTNFVLVFGLWHVVGVDKTAIGAVASTFLGPPGEAPPIVQPPEAIPGMEGMMNLFMMVIMMELMAGMI